MAGELPDLNKQNVGWIAYYNVVDNTDVTQSDLTDGTKQQEGDDGPAELESMISDRNKENIDYYDNGVVVKYLGRTRLVTIRFKTDGWITAHMDRNRSHARNQGSPDDLNGVADIADWKDDVIYNNGTDASESSLVNNTLERAINTALKQMSNYDADIKDKYDPNDVKLYNYEFETNNATLLSDAKVAKDNEYTYEFQYTDATEVQHVSVAVAHATDDRNVEIKTDNDTVFLTQPRGHEEWAVYNATTEFNNLSSGEPLTIEAGLDYPSDYREYSIHVVVVWN